MTTRRAAITLLALALGCTSAAGQGRVTIASDGSKELKRSAHRLRIPVERLRNARSALREATDLARRLDPAPIESFSNLASLWTQLDSKSAPAVFDELFRDLRTAASGAKEEREYTRATGTAHALLSGIIALDYEKAEALARTWPDPPAALGEPASTARTSMLDGLRGQALNHFAYNDPQRALALVEAGAKLVEFAPRAALVRNLAANGRREDAARLIDRAKADFAQRPNAAVLYDYSSFVGQIAEADQEKALDAFRDLSRAAESAAPGLPATTLRIGERSTTLSPAESILLNTIRSFSARPDLVRRALDIAPDLRTKLDGVGGIDSALHPVQGRGSNPGTGAPTRSAGQIAAEVRGKAETDPATVRGKLSEIAVDADGIGRLLQLAQQVSYQDPDLASLAVETAAGLLPRIEPKFKRSQMLQQLVRISRQVDGEVDPNLIREGFILADDLRQEWTQRSATNPDGSPFGRGIGSSPADYLESMLVAEYARDDFDGAMGYVRSMPDGRHKLSTLLGICQAMRNNY